MTSPNKIPSASLNYTPAQPLSSTRDEGICSGITQKCYATKQDFVSDLVQYQKDRQLKQAAALFQKNPPVQIQPKNEDAISSMWSGVKGLWNGGDYVMSLV